MNKKKEINEILNFNKNNLIKCILLLESSLTETEPYNINKKMTPKESEPYDAMSDRFMRSVELSIKYFKTYEMYMQSENSDTYRDLLNKMEGLGIISSRDKWFKMRDIRNRIVHEYLPEDIKEIYDLIMDDYGKELIDLKNKLENYIVES